MHGYGSDLLISGLALKLVKLQNSVASGLQKKTHFICTFHAHSLHLIYLYWCTLLGLQLYLQWNETLTNWKDLHLKNSTEKSYNYSKNYWKLNIIMLNLLYGFKSGLRFAGSILQWAPDTTNLC